MIYSTLISPLELADRLSDDGWVVVDTRFSLSDAEGGRRDYLDAHIAGAVYAHLDDDLSGAIVRGKSGRHPLPSIAEMEDTFGSLGIAEGVQVVVYDDAGGGIAARLWWMLHFLGHDAAAVLDGGWPHWIGAGLPTRSGSEQNSPRAFSAQHRSDWIVNADEVDEVRVRPDWRVIDARDAARYRGDLEPIDPVAGHIPGARSAPYTDNLDASGLFLQPEDLRRRFEDIIGDTPGDRVVSYCGSGVTAAHNLLAMVHADLGYGRLYPGSWSEWITDPNRAVEKDASESA